MDVLLLNKVRNIMAEVIDEAALQGITLSVSEAYKIALERYEHE